MEITNNIGKYYNEIVDIAYEKYIEETEKHHWLVKRSRQSFESFFKEKFGEMSGIFGLVDNDCSGFLLYILRDDGDIYCDIPVWGYGAKGKNSIKILACLFQHLAEKIVLDKKVHFSVRLYACDKETQKLFSFMEFGIQSEKCIRHIEEIEHTSKYRIREISKNEMKQKWKEIWGLLLQLISHLQKSPVFYPGNEFTEEVYKEFFTDVETKVFVAEDKNRIIGLIEANSENMKFLFPNIQSLNVGEIYVEPEYRGKKVAQALLHYLDTDLKANNVEYEWVEHGTANPTARGFWNKYFETYEYEFIRSIER